MRNEFDVDHFYKHTTPKQRELSVKVLIFLLLHGGRIDDSKKYAIRRYVSDDWWSETHCILVGSGMIKAIPDGEGVTIDVRRKLSDELEEVMYR